MSTITVNTTSDVVNANDGVTSLREAIAQAGAGDTIGFAAALDHQTISLAQGLVLSRDVVIDGDRNNDGLADITFNGQSNGLAFPILTVMGAGTHVVIDGVIFTGGEPARRAAQAEPTAPIRAEPDRRAWMCRSTT